MSAIEVDVLVLGAGPSGCAAALRLLTLGHRVALVERCAFPRPQIGESLSPGVGNILDYLGAGSAIGGAKVVADLPARVAWGGREAESIPAPDRNPGVVVDRGEFDSLLRTLAEDRGALVIQPARVRRVDGTPGAWRATVRGSDAEVAVETRLIVDARGRAGGNGRTRTPTGPATLAVWAQIDGGLLPRETRIEALDRAWLWSSPLPDGRHRVMAFLDPGSWPGGGDKEGRFRRLLASGELFDAAASAAFSAPLRSCSATPYLDVEPWRPGIIKIGEGAMAVDPLSSSGVERSMRLSLQAVIASNTFLRDPSTADLARDFYLSRLVESAASHAAWTRGYYAQACRDPGLPFWRDRSNAPPSRGDDPVGVAALLRASVERLEGEGDAARTLDPAWVERAAPDRPWAARIALSPRTEFLELPCVVEDRVQLRTAIRHPGLDHPVGFLEGYEIVPLLRLAPLARDLGQLVGLWGALVPGPIALRLAGWLGERGILRATSPD